MDLQTKNFVSNTVAKREDGGDNVDVSTLLAEIEDLIQDIKASYAIEKRGTDSQAVESVGPVALLSDVTSVLAALSAEVDLVD